MSDIFERIVLLKQSPIFAKVGTEDLRTVAQVLEEEIYFPGDRIFEINEHGDHMYVLESGKVGISFGRNQKTPEFVAILGAGECLGEMNLLDELPRSATAHVLEKTHALSLEKSRLRTLIISYPELGLGMLRGLSLRLRNANTWSQGLHE